MKSCVIVEWPHSRALGAKWFVYPPAGIPPEIERHGFKAFASLSEAEEHAGNLELEYGL